MAPSSSRNASTPSLRVREIKRNIRGDILPVRELWGSRARVVCVLLSREAGGGNRGAEGARKKKKKEPTAGLKAAEGTVNEGHSLGFSR